MLILVISSDIVIESDILNVCSLEELVVVKILRKVLESVVAHGAIGKIKKRCDDSSRKVSCQFTDWSSWGPCKHLDSSPVHIEEGLICGDSVQERSRHSRYIRTVGS